MSDVSQPQTTDSRPAHNRRHFRSHMVNRDVRLRLVVDDVLFALIAALAAIGILYVLSNREIGDNLYSAHLSIKETRELLTNGVKVAGVVTFIAVLLFGFWSLIDAHRIAGPMHRLHRLLNQIAEGNLDHEIRFRKRDEFPEVAAAADRMVDVYVDHLAAVRRQAETLRQGLSADTPSAEQLRALRQTATQLTEELNFFRLPAEGQKAAMDGSAL